MCAKTDWIQHATKGMPVDRDTTVDVMIDDREVTGLAWQFDWTPADLMPITQYRVHLTDDMIAEEEEWQRLSKRG